MSHGYRAVQWTKYKRNYDLAAIGVIAIYLVTFVIISKLVRRGAHAISDEILIMRALATCAFFLLTLILCIGPLCRLDRRFLPLLYNRRHLGVMTCLIAMLHALLAIGFYHGFGIVNPLVSALTSNTQYRSISAFPFEILGAIALLILILMAATSHDFWLKNLSPGVWKGLHMLVYPAWVLVVGHIALGALQAERNALYAVLLILLVAFVAGLHLITGFKEWRKDRATAIVEWIQVGPFAEMRDQRAMVVCVSTGERIAVFRNGDRVSAISNVCAHQGGPLGEGKILDGCVTCPWHGFQYRAEDGCAPPPFTEKVAAYPVRIENGEVFVSTSALAPGTSVEPAVAEENHDVRRENSPPDDEFFVGYLPTPRRQGRFLLFALAIILFGGSVLATVIASRQRDPGGGQWDLSQTPTLEGILYVDPYPVLCVDHTGAPERVLLIGDGKIGGMPERLRSLDRRRVRIAGHLIQRDGRTLLEIESSPEAVGFQTAPPSSIVRYNPTALTGEVIDPKCFHGAMKPGEGKTHKACAALCLRGGIPPMLLAQSGACYLLTDEKQHALAGELLNDVVQIVGDRVRVEGEAGSIDGQRILKIGPHAFSRLTP